MFLCLGILLDIKYIVEAGTNVNDAMDAANVCYSSTYKLFSIILILCLGNVVLAFLFRRRVKKMSLNKA
jgi:hypothetical protein